MRYRVNWNFLYRILLQRLLLLFGFKVCDKRGCYRVIPLRRSLKVRSLYGTKRCGRCAREQYARIYEYSLKLTCLKNCSDER